jgi:hypothetical protein
MYPLTRMRQDSHKAAGEKRSNTLSTNEAQQRADVNWTTDLPLLPGLEDPDARADDETLQHVKTLAVQIEVFVPSNLAFVTIVGQGSLTSSLG